MGVDLVEGRRELFAQAVHRSDGSNCDQRSDQAVFDCGSAFFVTAQLVENFMVSPGSVFIPGPPNKRFDDK